MQHRRDDVSDTVFRIMAAYLKGAISRIGLGYDLATRIMTVMYSRLQATRLRLLAADTSAGREAV